MTQDVYCFVSTLIYFVQQQCSNGNSWDYDKKNGISEIDDSLIDVENYTDLQFGLDYLSFSTFYVFFVLGLIMKKLESLPKLCINN